MRPYLLAIFMMFFTIGSLHAEDRQGTVPLQQVNGSARKSDAQPILKVYDANGRLVGALGTFGGFGEPGTSYDAVSISVDGAMTFAAIERISDITGAHQSPTQFRWSLTQSVVFEGPSCTGTPVIDYRTSGPRPSVAVLEGNDIVLYVASSANTGATIFGSQRFIYADSVQCNPGDGSIGRGQGALPESSVVLTQRYPEPLTIGF
jgi:hypothetical protein